jgi:hypothetical protein
LRDSPCRMQLFVLYAPVCWAIWFRKRQRSRYYSRMVFRKGDVAHVTTTRCVANSRKNREKHARELCERQRLIPIEVCGALLVGMSGTNFHSWITFVLSKVILSTASRCEGDPRMVAGLWAVDLRVRRYLVQAP